MTDELPYVLAGRHSVEWNDFVASEPRPKSHRKPRKTLRSRLRDLLDPWRRVKSVDPWADWTDVGTTTADDIKVYDAPVGGNEIAVNVDTDGRWFVYVPEGAGTVWVEPAQQTMTFTLKDVNPDTMELASGLFLDGAGEDPPIYAELKQADLPTVSEAEIDQWAEDDLEYSLEDDERARQAFARRLSRSTGISYVETIPSVCGCSVAGPCYEHR